ncbi:hypothetical protein AB1K56_07100 [Microbacterium sp. BWR-S6Y]|uniref:hypothetical protein n=1 Tax=Microbacterium sp. BWR-S6Y TaxID=3232073 RepID=UPI003527C574
MFPLPDVPWKFDPSYWAQVGEWIEAVAGRHLRATENTEAFPATASDLAEHIWSEIRISTNGQHPWERRYGMTSAAMDKRVWAKAEHMLATFAPAVPRGPFPRRFTRPFTTEESSRGGRASKRPSRVLAGLRTLPADITAAAAAEALGCTERQVYTARAVLKEERRVRSIEEELNALFGPIYPADTETDRDSREADAREPDDPEADTTFEDLMAEAGIGVDAGSDCNARRALNPLRDAH